MKVSKDGKVLKNAKVLYTTGGVASLVDEGDGVMRDARVYQIEDGKADKQTKPAETKKKTVKDKLSSVLSTKDVKRK